MKIKLYTIIILLCIYIANLQSQDYLISFAGSGASSTVAPVKVENLIKGTFLTMSGSNVLHLMGNILGVEPGTSETMMQYNTGDRLKFTGISDIYSTVITDVPVASKTITFNFIACTDGDGNNYPIVAIGNQVWMAENLRTCKYNDGGSIPKVTSSDGWPQGVEIPVEEFIGICTYELSGAYGWSGNDSANCEYPYGKIYNWGAVETGKLCPSGFRVPDFDELETLFSRYYQEFQSGTELMATDAWPDTMFKWGYKPTNSTGFSALPSHPEGTLATFWTASGTDMGECGFAQIDIAVANTIPYVNYHLSYYNYWRPREYAFNIRCLKNPPLPLVSTNNITSIGSRSAVCGGNIANDEAGVEVTSRGVCWGKSENPTISDKHTLDGMGAGTFISNLSELSFNTKYYVRAYATNATGTTYGEQVSFTTLPADPIVFNPELTYGTVTDIEGNIYKTIQIGTQIWMAENLKTTKYNDGTSIPYITDNSEWANMLTDAYCWYFNDETTFKPVYGGLYNWYAVNTAKLCPSGWHVPSDTEWHTLVLALDPYAQNIFGTESSIAGGKLKEISLNHWKSPNMGATNVSGFTAIPGGLRDSDGVCEQIQLDGYALYWSSTEIGPTAYSRMIGYNQAHIYRKAGSKVCGLSVRCLQDQYLNVSSSSISLNSGSGSYKEEVMIYPNPTDDEIKVTWEKKYSYRLNITIYNVLGKAIKEVQTDPDVNEVGIDLEGNSRGIYLFEMKDNKNNLILNRSRIIKK